MDHLINEMPFTLDVEWLLSLSEEEQRAVVDVAKWVISFPPNGVIDRPLAMFLRGFLEWHQHSRQAYPKRSIISMRLDDYARDSGFIRYREPLALKQLLNQQKDAIDLYHQYDKRKEVYYSKATKLYDRFSTYKMTMKPYYRISNAWLKCWEMIHAFSLIPDKCPHDFIVFCNAEFPGSFIFAIHHYIQTKSSIRKYQWVANSLWPGERGILKDEYGLYRKYRERWLMDGEKRSGDVMDPEMLRYLLTGFPYPHLVDLYTSDIGIALQHGEFNDQEEMETPLNLGQIVQGLCTLRQGGSMVCKMFEFFSAFNVTLLSLLSGMFDKFYVTKPATSRPANSEIYLVGKGFHGYERHSDTIHVLANDYLFRWTPEMNRKPIYLHGKEVEVARDFYLRIVYASYEIYQRQIRFIQENIRLAEGLSQAYPDPKMISVERLRTIPELWKEWEYREAILQDWIRAYPIPELAPSRCL